MSDPRGAPAIPPGGHPLPDADQYSPAPPLPDAREAAHVPHPPAASTLADAPPASAPHATLPLDAWHRAQGARMVPFAASAAYHRPDQPGGGNDRYSPDENDSTSTTSNGARRNT